MVEVTDLKTFFISLHNVISDLMVHFLLFTGGRKSGGRGGRGGRRDRGGRDGKSHYQGRKTKFDDSDNDDGKSSYVNHAVS